LIVITTAGGCEIKVQSGRSHACSRGFRLLAPAVMDSHALPLGFYLYVVARVECKSAHLREYSRQECGGCLFVYLCDVPSIA
jgi:hypothetical protein